MATRVLQKVQGALESTAGTFATATRKLYGSDITHERTIASIRPDYLDGTYNQSRVVYEGIETNAFTISGPFAFNQGVFWLSAAVGSATATGGSAPYSWTFNAASTADTTRSFSLEYAYSDGGAGIPASFRVAGNKVNALTINWAKDDVVTFEAGIISFKGMTQGTALSATPSDTVEVHAVGANTTVYIDASAGTIGTTADANVAIASLSITNGFATRYGLDGSAVGAALDRSSKTEAVLTLTRHFQNDTELDAWETKELRKIRIVTSGTTLGAGNYEMTVDFYGVIDEITQTDVDGSVAQEIVLRPYVDGSTVTVPFSVVLKNNQATIS
jgi:hypothetical protein